MNDRSAPFGGAKADQLNYQLWSINYSITSSSCVPSTPTPPDPRSRP